MCYIETTAAIHLGKYFTGDIKQFIPQTFWESAEYANKVALVLRARQPSAKILSLRRGVRAAY